MIAKIMIVWKKIYYEENDKNYKHGNHTRKQNDDNVEYLPYST